MVFDSCSFEICGFSRSLVPQLIMNVLMEVNEVLLIIVFAFSSVGHLM